MIQRSKLSPHIWCLCSKLVTHKLLADCARLYIEQMMGCCMIHTGFPNVMIDACVFFH